MRTPSPPDDLSGPAGAKWARDLTSLVDQVLFFQDSPPQVPTVPYANLTGPKPRYRVGQPRLLLYVPDHPQGPSFLLSDGAAWRRFTSAGGL